MIYLIYHCKSQGKVKDKEHLNLRSLVQVGPGDSRQRLAGGGQNCPISGEPGRARIPLL